MGKHDPARPYIRAFYEHNRLLFAVALILRILGVTGMLFLSWMLGSVIDTVRVGGLSGLGRLAVLAAGFVAFMTAVELGFYRAQSTFIHRALAQYKALAFEKLSEKSISAFTRENTGRYLSVLSNDVNTLEENYLNRFFELIAQPLTFFATLGLMLWYSPLLTLAAALLCLLPFAAALLLGPGLSRAEKTVSDAGERFTAKLKDLLSGFAVIKSFKAEGETGALFRRENAALEATKRRRRWQQGLLATVSGGMGMVMQLGLFFIGAYLAIQGKITAGTVLIFVNLCNCLIQPLQTVPQALAARKAARGLILKLAELTEANTRRQGETMEPRLREAIELKNLRFGYEPDRPVLQGLSLRLEAGKKYALVGASGSGKSTLLNLMMGAYDNYEGSICFDGRELKDIAPDSLYDLISLIGQNVFLFDDTLARNITMFRPFPQALVDRAAEQAGLAELIAQRGENTPCGENGAGLSGGERQRISIARCLLRGTPVLLLDEATAALDNQTAFSVTDAILRLDGLTRLVVTHRLDPALLERYDEIFVLRDGRLTEHGSFTRLMEEKGYFYSLYTVSH